MTNQTQTYCPACGCGEADGQSVEDWRATLDDGFCAYCIAAVEDLSFHFDLDAPFAWHNIKDAKRWYYSQFDYCSEIDDPELLEDRFLKEINIKDNA